MVSTIGGIRYKDVIDIPIADISLIAGAHQLVTLTPALQYFGLKSGAIVFLQANLSYDGGAGTDTMSGAYYAINLVYQNGTSFIAKNMSKLALVSADNYLVTHELGNMLSAPVFRVDCLDVANTVFDFEGDSVLATTFESIVAYIVRMDVPGVFMGMTSPIPGFSPA